MEHVAPQSAVALHIAGHTIYITNSIINTWIIMLIVLIACVALTRNLKIVPRGPQIVLEMLVGWINNFLKGTLGEEGKAYFPYLASVIIYLGIANTIGFFGFTPPTKDINVTAGLALMSIILIQICGIRKKGVGGWLHSFLEPIVIVSPINILELGIKPLSLCMRLFGNVLGAFIIMELLKGVCAFFIPVVFSCYFDLFDGLIQAYVFVFLTSLFMKESLE
jgi:F-type H+-transporting ATPase subunit a